MTVVEVKVPDIGDFKDVAVIELLVKPGDSVARDQSLVTVESDKASMEIPSSHAGVVRELRVALGDRVSQGSALALVGFGLDLLSHAVAGFGVGKPVLVDHGPVAPGQGAVLLLGDHAERPGLVEAAE